MKINDLVVADCIYSEENNLSNEIRNLEYPQKYILLEIGNEIISLEIDCVSRTAIYLKIIDDKKRLKV